MSVAVDEVRKARFGQEPDFAALLECEVSPFQLGALTCALQHHDLQKGNVELQKCLLTLRERHGLPPSNSDPETGYWRRLVDEHLANRPLNAQSVKRAFNTVSDAGPEEAYWCGYFLMAVTLRGAALGDDRTMTECMVGSGGTIDLRDRYKRRGVSLVRRYPTGGLSEKIALIMPAILAMVGDELRVKSPFFVARSLSFTGGTWDKLSSVPGFRFPEGEAEICDTLDRASAAMIVTHAGINPADEVLYQVRSKTCTVESAPLIISSISSKHISVPVNHLVLDARTGPGAFLRDRSEAAHISSRISAILSEHEISTTTRYTENNQPDGSCIGNYIEVLEAVEILKGGNSVLLNNSALRHQVDKCLEMLYPLVADKTELSEEEYCLTLRKRIANGEMLAGFSKLLRNHQVSETTVNTLLTDGWSLLGSKYKIPLLSRRNGTLVQIDQKRLGYIVNELLGGGGNRYGGNRDLYAGVILSGRLGDEFSEGQPICQIIGDPDLVRAALPMVERCFSWV